MVLKLRRRDKRDGPALWLSVFREQTTNVTVNHGHRDKVFCESLKSWTTEINLISYTAIVRQRQLDLYRLSPPRREKIGSFSARSTKFNSITWFQLAITSFDHSNKYYAIYKHFQHIITLHYSNDQWLAIIFITHSRWQNNTKNVRVL